MILKFLWALRVSTTAVYLNEIECSLLCFYA
jgi:hypothetical protein